MLGIKALRRFEPKPFGWFNFGNGRNEHTSLHLQFLLELSNKAILSLPAILSFLCLLPLCLAELVFSSFFPSFYLFYLSLNQGISLSLSLSLSHSHTHTHTLRINKMRNFYLEKYARMLQIRLGYRHMENLRRSLPAAPRPKKNVFPVSASLSEEEKGHLSSLKIGFRVKAILQQLEKYSMSSIFSKVLWRDFRCSILVT